jgi:hypothetical protein
VLRFLEEGVVEEGGIDLKRLFVLGFNRWRAWFLVMVVVILGLDLCFLVVFSQRWRVQCET